MSVKLVYVLEDDPDISEVITFILHEAGYQVAECRTVRQFHETIKVQMPDLFILDILLPDGSGLDVCKALRSNKTTAAIPVLMMSAHRTKRDIEAFGCQADFISKPFDIDRFTERVQRYA